MWFGKRKKIFYIHGTAFSYETYFCLSMNLLFKQITPVTSIASIQANRCRDGERYSEELRKCVKDQRFVVPYTLFLNLKNNHVTKIIYLKCGHEKN